MVCWCRKGSFYVHEFTDATVGATIQARVVILTAQLSGSSSVHLFGLRYD